MYPRWTRLAMVVLIPLWLRELPTAADELTRGGRRGASGGDGRIIVPGGYGWYGGYGAYGRRGYSGYYPWGFGGLGLGGYYGGYYDRYYGYYDPYGGYYGSYGGYSVYPQSSYASGFEG